MNTEDAKDMDYEIIVGATPKVLTDMVRARMQEGWRPVGGPVVVNDEGAMAQAVVCDIRDKVVLQVAEVVCRVGEALFPTALAGVELPQVEDSQL